MEGERMKRAQRSSSFKVAWDGIVYAATTQVHMKIHLFAASLAMILGFIYQLTRFEWLFILSLIGLVIAMELLNTAIERTVDLITTDFHPLAKIAKDVAAGAVLVTAVFAMIAGIIIFIPHIID